MSRKALSQTNQYVTVKDWFKGSFKIPSEWIYPKFSDVVKVNPQTKISSKQVQYVPMDAVNIQRGCIDYFEERDINENLGLPRFVNNDVLFARITPSTENGKICIVENFYGEGIASSELIVLRPTDKVIPRYLYYFVQSHRIKKFAISQMMGTTGRQRVPDRVFKRDLSFELPSLVEQQKIASILLNVDKLIQKTDQILERVQLLKKGLMQRLLTKGIGHTRFKKIKEASSLIDFVIPEAWQVNTLENISSIIKDGPMGFNLHNYDYVENGIPILRIQNLKNLTVTKDDLRYISHEKHEELKKSQVKENDIIISKTGILGVVGVVPVGYGPANLNQALARITLKDLNIVPFVAMFLSSKVPQGILSIVGSGRTVQAGLKMSDIKNLIIPIPPKKELEEIIRKISLLDLWHANELNILSNYQYLKKGLMQNLITGKIRVKV